MSICGHQIDLPPFGTVICTRSKNHSAAIITLSTPPWTTAGPTRLTNSAGLSSSCAGTRRSCNAD